MAGNAVHLNFRDDRSRTAVLQQDAALSSARYGWTSVYFEHRREQNLKTVDHVLQEHYLMVKLNPISRAERMLDGAIKREVQRKGATAFVPSGCPHRVHYDGELGSLNLMTLAPSLVQAVADELGIRRLDFAPRFATEEDSFVLSVSELMFLELQQGNPHGAVFADTFARSLAVHLLTGFGVRGAGDRKGVISARKLQWLDEYIEAHIAHPISLSELAQQAGLSEYYFCRQFKQATGISPYQYLLKKRIQYACACLEKDSASIQDIAFAGGFGDPVQFSKLFKRMVGMTPTHYRRQRRTSN